MQQALAGHTRYKLTQTEKNIYIYICRVYTQKGGWQVTGEYNQPGEKHEDRKFNKTKRKLMQETENKTNPGTRTNRKTDT